MFWMHAGFCLLEAGSIRSKNVINILFKNVLNVLITTLLWWFFGYSFAFGKSNSSGFIGGSDKNTYTTVEIWDDADQLNFWLFQWAFAATALTIVSGGMAERANTWGYLILIFGFQLIIYPTVAHWVWSDDGWLKSRGFLDFAGSGVVHCVGGFAALVGCVLLGPRRGKVESHSMPLVVLGTFILWMGWFGFNGASSLSLTDGNALVVGRVLINTTLSASVCGLTVLSWNYIFTKRFSVGELCNAILAGLVSITAGCDGVTDWGALLIGFIGAFWYILGKKMLYIFGVDDAIGAFPVHGACGAWGVLATGLFNVEVGAFYNASEANVFGVQCYGLLAIIGWTVSVTLVFLMGCKFLGILRISAEIEDQGLDEYYHIEEGTEFDKLESPFPKFMDKLFKRN